MIFVNKSVKRVVCPNFVHPALTSLFTNYSFFQVKYSFAYIVNGLSVLKLFQLSNGDSLFSEHLQSAWNDEVWAVCTKLRNTTLVIYKMRQGKCATSPRIQYAPEDENEPGIILIEGKIIETYTLYLDFSTYLRTLESYMRLSIFMILKW